MSWWSSYSQTKSLAYNFMRFQVSCSKLLKHESYDPDTGRANHPYSCAKASLQLPAVSPKMAERQSPSQVMPANSMQMSYIPHRVSNGLRCSCGGKCITGLLTFKWAAVLWGIYWLHLSNDCKDCNDCNVRLDDNMMTFSFLNPWVESHLLCFQQWSAIIVTIKEIFTMHPFLCMPL